MKRNRFPRSFPGREPPCPIACIDTVRQHLTQPTKSRDPLQRCIVARNICGDVTENPKHPLCIRLRTAKIKWCTGGISQISEVHIDKSSANQHCGRAGRVALRRCYRMYSKNSYPRHVVSHVLTFACTAQYTTAGSLLLLSFHGLLLNFLRRSRQLKAKKFSNSAYVFLPCDIPWPFGISIITRLPS